ncbi:MAG: DNA gyrase subunit A [Chloroflexi bacterium]|nr:DNA gyrase subunit A [Chloroflexota bacterium]
MVLGNTKPIQMRDEMQKSYLAYAMSVIISRALPDARDGLKPVHRRILYAMNDMGLKYNTSYKKSARIVGEVLGKYHPHGDSSVYDAMVRMAQDFSMRYPLVEGQGNFGSVDDDPPAAMRYTEAKLAKISEALFIDIDKDTVPFSNNFDDSLTEPIVLPTRLPGLLINGSSGIAVGMATNIPPHNLGEVCDALVAYIDDENISLESLMQHVKGPDFPTAGIILGKEGIKQAFATGQGKVIVRARVYISEGNDTDKRKIVITELPYLTNKAALVAKIADLGKEKTVVGIGEVRDESDRQGMRVVIELKRDAQPQKVLNALYKYTALQSSFPINMIALVDGQPQTLTLKEALRVFVEFRQEVVTKRTRFELKSAKERAHILEGLTIALDNIDRVIEIIRFGDEPKSQLMTEFALSAAQTQAILDLQLKRLAKLESTKIKEEYDVLLKLIEKLIGILNDKKSILVIVRQEILEVKERYANLRRTEIAEQAVATFSEEDLVPHESMVVTISSRGFVKRVPAQVYRAQHRGGKGIIGMTVREQDDVRHLTIADTHDCILFFTTRGKIFSNKCHELPEDRNRTAKGMAVINLFPIGEKERVTTIMAVPEFKEGRYMIMATKMGEVKKINLSEFAAVRSSGLLAMDFAEGDELVSACIADENEDVIIITEHGQSITFPASDIRTSQRASGGVCGIKLGSGDSVVAMDIMKESQYVLVASENGYGKLTPQQDYPRQKRSGSGVRTFNVVTKSGKVVGAEVVSTNEELMVITKNGIVIRTPIREGEGENSKGISIQGRTTQGVKIIDLDDGDSAVAISTSN